MNSSDKVRVQVVNIFKRLAKEIDANCPNNGKQIGNYYGNLATKIVGYCLMKIHELSDVSFDLIFSDFIKDIDALGKKMSDIETKHSNNDCREV